MDVRRSSLLPLTSPIVVPLNRTAVNVTLAFQHAAVVVLDVTAVDGVGNRGVSTWTWTMETQPPVTVWPPLPPLVNNSALLLSFNCTKVAGCSFVYSLDGAAPRPLGNATAEVAPVEAAPVDTVTLMSPPLLTRSPNATFVFDAVVSSGVAGAVAVDVLVDDAEAWKPLAVNSPLTLTGLSDGVHTLAARAVYVFPCPAAAWAFGVWAWGLQQMQRAVCPSVQHCG